MHSRGFVIESIKSTERGKLHEKKTKYYFPSNRRRKQNDKGKSNELKSYRDGFYSQVLPGSRSEECKE